MKTIAQQLNITEFPFEIMDKNGREIYRELSDGYWSKYEYDSNGDEIYFEDSDGYWIKREYDSNGNIIYWENSTGRTFDNRHKSCEGKIVEIDGKKYELKEMKKTAEEITNEMMEQTDEMLVEIHKNISEKLGEASADKWVEMLKQVREREVEKQTNEK